MRQLIDKSICAHKLIKEYHEITSLLWGDIDMITGVFAVEGMFVSIEPGTISGKITKIDRIKEDLWGEPCRSFLLDAIEQGNYEKDWIK